MKKIVPTILILALVGVAVYYLWDRFRARSLDEKIAEILYLQDSRLLNSTLTDYLDDADVTVRTRAALAVGRIGGAEAASRLRPLLADSSLDVASTAAFAIGLTGDTAMATPLVKLAFDLPSPVATAAVIAVGRLADSTMTSVHQSLSTYLDHPSPDTRRAACLALFYAGAKSQAGALIDFVRRESDHEARVAGIYALSRLGVAGADDVFAEYLADADPFARECCVRGLGQSQSELALHDIAIALHDGDGNVVVQAARQLGRAASPKAHEHLAETFERISRDNLVVTMLEALQRQGNPAGVEHINELIKQQPSNWVLAAAVKYLAAVQGDHAVPLLDSLSRSADPRIRAACAEAYGLIADAKMIPRLATLFSDIDPLVRLAAMQALLTADTANAAYYVDKALGDSDWVMASQAIEQVGAAPMSSFEPRLAEMSKSSASLAVDLRRSLVQAADKLLAHDPGDSLAQLILADGALDTEYLVRREAADVYRKRLGRQRDDIIGKAKPRFSQSKLVKALKQYPDNPSALVITNRGKFEMELFFDVAPITVLSFIELARSGFYQGLSFHRVVPGFVVQGGDPRGDGWGGPDWFLRCEYSAEPFERGTVGIATSGKDSGGSQFFVCLSPQPHLEGRYTVLGQVTSGMDVVDQLLVGDTIQQITIQ